MHGSSTLDYDAVPASLADAAVKPGDPAYGRLTSTYFRGGAPGIVLLPRTVEQVVDAVDFAGRHLHVPLGIRSGGHGLSGRSTNDGGIVIDLRHLNGIDVLDPAARLVRIGPGARWRDVAAALQPHGWALSSGDSGAVGVGGLATSGGIGLLARAHGLTIDRLVAAHVVLADGSVVVADEHENQELFWAVRGAGANFGVVVSFDFVVDEVDQVGLALLTHLVEDPASFLVAFGEVASSAPRDTTAVLLAAPGDAGPLALTIAVVVDSADRDTIVARLQPFVELAPLVQHQVVVTPYAGVMNLHASRRAARPGRAGRPLGPAERDHARVRAQRSRHCCARDPSSSSSCGASAGRRPTCPRMRPPSPTAKRSSRSTRSAPMRVSVDRHWTRIRPHLGGIYLPFETDQDPARLGEAFPPATLARLRALKRELDPRNLFRDNFNVDPDGTTTDAAPAAAVPG